MDPRLDDKTSSGSYMRISIQKAARIPGQYMSRLNDSYGTRESVALGRSFA